MSPSLLPFFKWSLQPSLCRQCCAISRCTCDMYVGGGGFRVLFMPPSWTSLTPIFLFKYSYFPSWFIATHYIQKWHFLDCISGNFIALWDNNRCAEIGERLLWSFLTHHFLKLIDHQNFVFPHNTHWHHSEHWCAGNNIWEIVFFKGY